MQINYEMTESEFDAMSDAEKIGFMSNLLAKMTESLNASNQLIAELTEINTGVIGILEGAEENV